MKALNSVLKNRTAEKKTRKKSTKIFVLLWGNLGLIGHYGEKGCVKIGLAA